MNRPSIDTMTRGGLGFGHPTPEKVGHREKLPSGASFRFDQSFSSRKETNDESARQDGDGSGRELGCRQGGHSVAVGGWRPGDGGGAWAGGAGSAASRAWAGP